MRLILTVLLAAGCGSSTPDDHTDSADTGPTTTTTDTTTDTDDSTNSGAEDCPWVGTWELVNAKCGLSNFNTWFQTYQETWLVISHNNERGCDMSFTLENPMCFEEATWFADPETTDTNVSISSEGVTACDPAACQFAGSDTPCELGAHGSDMEVLVDQSTPDGLIFTWMATYAAPSCDDTFQLVFARQ